MKAMAQIICCALYLLNRRNISRIAASYVPKLCIPPFRYLSAQFVEVDVFIHELWFDWRLARKVKERIVVDPRWHKDIWTPEVYFKNSADGRLDHVIFPYAYITLEPSGVLFMAARVSLKLACNLDLTRFPHDNQLCDMQLSSRTFSCLYGRVELRRLAGYFLINKYAPSTIIVFMSFAAFWMPCEALPARVTLSVTSLLSLVTAQYQTHMPASRTSWPSTSG
ncbi:hypothetical protein HPB48_005539 [Haemaphysalis longicornis]|uniref:Uncharacterized protein n=1 Tax=Haemaphysalis longicornis TaxID=44386 RepID=A0A9J6GSH9_HAELO|nr:hypothetical protein HPB48_005539 [Haemaphysalis longicornis]